MYVGSQDGTYLAASRGVASASVFSYSLCALTYSVLGKLTWQNQPYGGLDLAGGQRASLVVSDNSRSLSSNSFEDVIHKRIHNQHTLVGDASIRVNLLEHLEKVCVI